MRIDFHTHVFPDKLAKKALTSISEHTGAPYFTIGTVADTDKKLKEWNVDSSVALHIATNPKQQYNVNNWAAEIQNKAGVVAKTVVLDPDAWKLFRSNASVEKYLDYRRGTNNTLNKDPIVRGKDSKARYVGSIGDFDLWVYNDSYIGDDGKTTNLLPSKTVILGSKDGLEGTRCYGAIHDEKANWTAQRYFTKSWIEEDPSVRWLLLQSAPLVVPYRPNASMCVTVG